jgi:outer membrane protein assembly factor BamB
MQPVQFICPNCNGDYSAFVNELIQRELAENFPSSSAAQPASPSIPASGSPGLRISRAHVPAAPVAAQESPEAMVCAKHNEPAAEHCTVCHKPICPKCMDIFGFFCSAYCKSKAEVGKMNVPAYAGSTFATEARFWRKMGWILGVAGTLAVLGLGTWIWYAWIASMPHQYFAATFDQTSHTGSSYLNDGQIVFLHGGTLARYDMKAGKQVWSKELVSQTEIDDVVKGLNEHETTARENSGEMDVSSVPSSLREKYARIGLEGALTLHCAGQNIWVADGGQLTQYDWNTGNVLQQVALPDGGEATTRGNELLTFGSGMDGAPSVVQVDLASGALTTNEFHDPAVAGLGQDSPPSGAAGPSSGGGLPLSAYQSAQPMDSRRVAQQAQNLSLQGQIALPAVIANNSYEQRLEGAMNDGQDRPRTQRTYTHPAKTAHQTTNSPPLDFTLIPDNDGYEEFSSEMIQENIVQREAMKAPASNSALESVSGGNEEAAVNEQLNDMQRQNGADKVTEDQSTYSITIRQAGSPQNSWTGEVIGPPQLIPLKTVNVLAAGKTVIVLDKTNKKLWQTTLTYDVTGGKQSPLEESPYGDGPCVEHDGVLYVFDQAVLSAFDLTTGNARWRIPTVGVVGLFFDEKGMLYVNTTTGNPDDIKYSRQIDVTKSTTAIILKIDPVAGKILWRSQGSGYVSYVSGQFIYAVQSFDPGDEEDQMTDNTLALLKPALTRIIRISPSDGHSLWQIDQPRAAMNVQFDGSYIHIIFKKQVQVLHYLAL